MTRPACMHMHAPVILARKGRRSYTMTMPGAWVLLARAARPKRQPGGSLDTLCVCLCARVSVWTVGHGNGAWPASLVRPSYSVRAVIDLPNLGSSTAQHDNVNSGDCDVQGWHVDRSTSDLAWYFGGYPAIVVGWRAQHRELTPLGVPCHRAMSYFGLCSTGEDAPPRLPSACKHHRVHVHIHIHPPLHPRSVTTICDRSKSALHTAIVAGLVLPRV